LIPNCRRILPPLSKKRAKARGEEFSAKIEVKKQ
jgi:hypothetical protein